MKILIATHNKDKYEIVRHLIKKCNYDFVFHSLSDLNIDDEVEETGGVKDRAKQKAEFYWNIVKDNFDIDCVIGIDDGIDFTAQGEGKANTKEITDKILHNNFLEKGKWVWIKRAYAVVGANLDLRVFFTSIPFIFLGNEEGITREEGKYPLSYVLGLVKNPQISVAQMDFKESIDYYFEYSADELQSMVSYITSLSAGQVLDR